MVFNGANCNWTKKFRSELIATSVFTQSKHAKLDSAYNNKMVLESTIVW